MMDSKLTIRLSPDLIEKAKIYASDHNISLSRIIAAYLESITRKDGNETKITPLIESLSGVINLPENYDYKDDYKDYLTEKYK